MRGNEALEAIDRQFTDGQHLAVIASSLCEDPEPAVYCHVSGSLDGENSALFLSAAKQLIEYADENGRALLVLNMEGLHYASSAGVGVLMSILTLARSSGVQIHLARLSDKVLSVIRLLGFESFFTII